jgi:hypothetical protein
VDGPDGTQFDSVTCHKAFVSAARLKALQNSVRVARSRSKALAIAHAAEVYRHLGGRDWPLVERLLRSIL